MPALSIPAWGTFRENGTSWTLQPSRFRRGWKQAEAGDHIFFLTDAYLARVACAGAGRLEHRVEHPREGRPGCRRCPTSIEIEYLQAWRARFHLAQGNLVEAQSWAETKAADRAGPFDPQLGARAPHAGTRVGWPRARRIRQPHCWNASGLQQKKSGRYGRALEAHMLQALADHAAGKDAQAIEQGLSRVLAQAKPEGYVRLFLDEGAPMARLLGKVSAGVNRGYPCLCRPIDRRLRPGPRRNQRPPPAGDPARQHAD